MELPVPSKESDGRRSRRDKTGSPCSTRKKMPGEEKWERGAPLRFGRTGEKSAIFAYPKRLL